jgi:hypothetical protein
MESQILAVCQLMLFLPFESSTILPHYLSKSAKQSDIYMLVQAWWTEHVIEDILLASGHDAQINSDIDAFQELLGLYKLARAQIEVQLYSAAVGNGGGFPMHVGFITHPDP